jgi:hypothetical protein
MPTFLCRFRNIRPRILPLLSALFFCAGLVLNPCPPALAADDLPVMSHDLSLVFDVPAHKVTIRDKMVLPAGLQHLRLGSDLEVTGINGSEPADLPGALATAEDGDGPYQQLDLTVLGLSGGGKLTLEYSGTFHQSAENMTFSRENVGNEITATISDEGIYLSSMAGWLAWHPEAMATHTVRALTPPGFETVTQGRRSRHELTADGLATTWEAAYPADGLNFIAAPFVVHEEPVREGVVSYTFLLEDDPRLRATYMERTKAYIAMYEEMIGPYPYAKFATVENWFPTGYGMPSYTLLGSQVLRLPFIPYTSFGHEIAHNWWGNSVFVDVAEGNWCEGLTVYCADYHYKELEDESQAREYRRNNLKDYAAYVHDPTKDFPLSEFKSRHSGATRAVGYGKSMMVFHMVNNMIGRDAFLQAIQQVAREHKFARTSWSDFFAAFSAASGRDFQDFQDQWLRRKGAPVLWLEDVEFTDKKVEFKLRQGAPAYALEVPVHVETSGGLEKRTVTVDKMNSKVSLEIQGARSVAIDPEYQLFRKLHPAEIEPTLSQVLAVEVPAFVLNQPTPELEEAALSFARGFCEMEEGFEFRTNGRLVEDPNPDQAFAQVIINPSPELLKRLQPDGLVVAGKSFYLDGGRYSLDTHDLVFAAADPNMPGQTDLVILCHSPRRLESLARRVTHYGKYSWLALPQGQGRVERGNWAAGDSPLVVRR